MAVRRRGLIVGGGVALALFAGAGFVVALARAGYFSGEEPLFDPNALSGIVALDDGAALFVSGGGYTDIGGTIRLPPRVLRRVELRDGELRERWRWTLPRPDAEMHSWQRSGRVIIGALRSEGTMSSEERMGGECIQFPLPRLVQFDATRGYRGHVINARNWVPDRDGSVLVQSYDTLVLMRDGRVRWRAPTPPSYSRITLTQAFAVSVTSDALRVFRRADGALVRELVGELQDDGGLVPEILERIVGVDPARDEILWHRRDGRVVVEALETGQERLRLDVGASTVAPDTQPLSPFFLGVSQDRWILVVPKHADTWRTIRSYELCAVERSSGRVAWRTDIGPLPVASASEAFVATPDAELPAELLLFLGSGLSYEHPTQMALAHVSLRSGAVRWRAEMTWDGDDRPRFTRAGRSAYLAYGDPPTIARFENGRFTSAVRLRAAQELGAETGFAEPTADELWSYAHTRWTFLGGRELSMRASAENAEAPLDARRRAIARLALPRAAL